MEIESQPTCRLKNYYNLNLLGSENERNRTKEMIIIMYHYISMYFLLFIPLSLEAKYEF